MPTRQPTADAAATIAERGGLSRSALMRRGWSHGMIVQFLPDGPDKSVPNPVIPGGVAMQVFSLARIEAVEASDEFVAAVAARRTKSVPISPR